MTVAPSFLPYDEQGTGPAVLLIHGFPLCRRMWAPQLAPLARLGYRVLAPDLPGFGASPAPVPPWTMDRYADGIIDLLDGLAIERAVVGGMSMGGYVLLNLLERHPRRVAAALFIATRAGADDPAGRERRTMLATAALKGEIGPIAEAFADNLFAAATPARRPDLVAEVRAWLAQASPTGLAAGLLAMRDRSDYAGRLHQFQVPALVIGGSEDRAIAPSQFQLLAAGLAGAASCLIPGGGHLVNLEQPEAFNAALGDFLATLKIG